MSWNRDLDQVEAKALHDLKIEGYEAVDRMHIIHFREIYDFISRFADNELIGKRLRMTTGEVPAETRKIVNTIGVDELWKYFSPFAFENKFKSFCKKLIHTKRIRAVDYIADGVIIADDIIVEHGEIK